MYLSLYLIISFNLENIRRNFLPILMTPKIVAYE